MKINKYEDISQIDREAKKDYVDRHSAFVFCDDKANKSENFKVKVKVGDEYKHPDDFDHYIAWVQLWDGEKMLAKAEYLAGTLGSEANHFEVDFYITPKKNMKLMAHAYCTKHGLWQSDEKIVEVV